MTHSTRIHVISLSLSLSVFVCLSLSLFLLLHPLSLTLSLSFSLSLPVPLSLSLSLFPPDLCAIHGMLREHWDMSGQSIKIRSYDAQSGCIEVRFNAAHCMLTLTSPSRS